MNIILSLQVLQLILAIVVVLMCSSQIKSGIGLKLNLIVLLLVSIMIIPPIGRNYISAVTIEAQI